MDTANPTPATPPRHRRRWPRMLLLAAMLLLLAPPLFLQTPPGKRALAAAAVWATDRFAGYTLEIGAISGGVPFSLRIDEAHVGDAAGRFVSLRGLALDLSAGALLRGQVHVLALEAQRIDLDRLPATANPPPEPAPYALPALPAPPAWLRVDRFAVGTLALGEDVAGLAADFTLEGGLGPARDGALWAAELDLRRLDADTTRVELDLRIDEDAARLRVHARDDALLPDLTGSPGPFALALDGAGPLDAWTGTVALDAGGAPLLSGTLGLREAEGDTALDAQIAAQPGHPIIPAAVQEWLGDALDLTLHARLTPEGALLFDALRLDAPRIALGIGGRVDTRSQALDLTVAATADGVATRLGYDAPPDQDRLAARFRLQGPLHALEVPARLTWDNQQIIDADLILALDTAIGVSGNALLQLPQALLPEAARAPVADGLRAVFDLTRHPDGAISVARFHATMQGNEIDASGGIDLAAERVNLNAAITLPDLAAVGALAAQPLAGNFTAQVELAAARDGMRATLKADATTLAYDDLRVDATTISLNASSDAWMLDDLSGLRAEGSARVAGLAAPGAPPTDWDATLEVASADSGLLQLRAFELRGSGLILRATGEVHPDTRAARVEATLEIADLAPPAALAGLELAGGITLRVDAHAEEDGTARLAWDGEARQVRGFHDAVAAIAGARLHSTGNARLAEGTLRVDAARMESATLSVDATADYALDSGALNLAARARVPDLASLATVLGQDIAGALDAKIEATGTTDNLTLAVQADAATLRLAEQPIESVALTLKVSGAPAAPVGEAALEVANGGARLSARTSLALDGDTLRLDDLTLRAGGNRIDGNLALDSAAMTGAGAIDAELPDLVYLGDALGLDLSGSATARVTLDQGDMRATVRADGLALPGLTLREIRLTATAASLMDAPTVDLALDWAGLATDAATVDTGTLRLDGNLADAEFSAEAKGSLPDMGAFRAALAGSASAERGEFALARLDANLEDHTAILVRPARLAYSGGVATVEALALEIAGGQLTADARYGDDALALSAALRGVPLSLVESFGGPELQGTLDAEATVSGRPDAPVGELRAKVAGLRVGGMAAAAPAMAAEATVNLDALQWQAQLRVDLPDAMDFAAEARLPAADLAAAQAEGFNALPLSGTLRASADLAALARAFDLKDHVVTGALQADLVLGGVVETPRLDGSLTLDKSSYENAVTGTLFRNIALRIEAVGDSLRVAQLRAEDAAGGHLEATGQVALDYPGGLPFNVDATLVNARLVHRDDLSAQVAGTLAVAGSLEGVAVTGDLTVGPARYVLPERMPPAQLASVDVVEVNHPNPGTQTETMESPPAVPVTLDIRCRIPGRVVIRGPVLDTEWGGDLRIRGSANDPRVEGSLAVVRGYLDFLGRRFDLRESTINFDGGPAINPYVNVAARSATRQLEAILRVTGTPDTLAFDLTSTPIYPQDEVLAQVLFNRGVNELTPVQALQLARAATLIGGNVGGMRFLSGNMGIGALDALDIRAGEDPGEVVVGVGKYLTDKIYAEVEQGTGPTSTNLRVNIELDPRFSVEAEAGAQSGVGVFYKRDY